MTEELEDGCMVRVPAQVMTRDESKGGWLAVAGGGVSSVSLSIRPAPASIDEEDESRATTDDQEYHIHGVRMKDQLEVLSCTIQKDFQYNKVMPTFHHWVSGAGKFGLTFQSAVDADKFGDKVKEALKTLLGGLGGAGHSLRFETKPIAEEGDDEENHIFECLHLPSGSSSEKSVTSYDKPDTSTPILSAINLPKHQSTDTSLKKYRMADDDIVCAEKPTPEDTYVQLTAAHEYNYPQLGSGMIQSEKSSPITKPPMLPRESGSAKTPLTYEPHDKRYAVTRRRCRYCSEWYSPEAPGACAAAPSRARALVDTLTCWNCANCFLYHCWADGEGEAYRYRWIPIGLLTLLLPCLCCHIPMRALAGRFSRPPHAPE